MKLLLCFFLLLAHTVFPQTVSNGDGGNSIAVIKSPVISSPANGATGVSVTLVLVVTSSSFTSYNSSVSHTNSDWEIRTAPNGAGSLITSSYNDSVNKTTITIAALTLTAGQTYYVRVRYKWTAFLSPWSADIMFST